MAKENEGKVDLDRNTDGTHGASDEASLNRPRISQSEMEQADKEFREAGTRHGPAPGDSVTDARGSSQDAKIGGTGGNGTGGLGADRAAAGGSTDKQA
ncbi:MAG TPA: hypothetical protein VEB20_07115 [Azospirillaceae bacterium]|nr:hypothetical protein [Azospirillaceae bacterium]